MKMNFRWKKFGPAVLVALAGLPACNTQTARVAGDDPQKQLRDTIVMRTDRVAQKSEQDRSLFSSAVISRQLDGDQCLTRTRHYNREVLDEVALYDINSDSMWVGNLVSASDASRGILNPVRASRAPLTVSIQGRARHRDGNALNSAAYTMKSPASSAFEDARLYFVGAGFEPQGNFQCDVKEAYSAEQAYFNLKTDANKVSGSIRAEIGGKSFRKGKIITINCIQKYYTINLDDPGSPAAFFVPSLSAGDLYRSLPADDSIAYLSSIHYGKRVIVLVKTEESASSIRASLDGKLGFATVGASLSSDAGKENTFISNDFKVLAEGAAPEDLRAILGVNKVLHNDQISPIFDKASEDRLVSYGVPISYNLRFLSNAKLMKVATVGDYEIPDYTDPSVPYFNDVRLRVSVGDDDVDHDTRFEVRRPDGRTLLVKDVSNGPSTTWRERSTHEALLGAVRATDLIGDWKVIVSAKGKDTVEYSLGLFADGGRKQVFRTSMSTLESAGLAATDAHRVFFEYPRVYPNGCQLTMSEYDRARAFEESRGRADL
jgi:hypothetical protein